MKVLQVVHNYTGAKQGGTERYTRWLVEALAERHDVSIFTTRVDPEASSLSIAIEGTQQPVAVVTRPRAGTLVSRRGLQRVIEGAFDGFVADRRFDLIHIQHLIDSSPGILRICAGRRIPTLVSLHDFWLACPRIHLVRKNLEPCRSGPMGGAACIAHCGPASDPLGPGRAPRPTDLPFVYRAVRNARLARRVRRFVAPSDYVRSRWAGLGLDPRRITVMPWGLPALATPFPGRPPATLPLRFVFLGALNRLKGADLAIAAFRDVGPERATLDLYGPMSGPDRRVLEPLLAAVPHVRWAGPAGPDEALRGADVLVVPSRQPETFSFVTHEAFQRRVPVIGSRSGALPDVIRDGVDGLLFERASELRAAIGRLVDDPGLVDRLRSAIRPVLGIDAHAEQLEQLYEELVVP